MKESQFQEMVEALKAETGCDVIVPDEVAREMLSFNEELYHGITYNHWLMWRPFAWLWKRFQCPKNRHLWDECLSSAGGMDEDGTPNHCLICDCCGLMVGISVIMTSEDACKRIEAYYDARREERAKQRDDA